MVHAPLEEQFHGTIRFILGNATEGSGAEERASAHVPGAAKWSLLNHRVAPSMGGARPRHSVSDGSSHEYTICAWACGSRRRSNPFTRCLELLSLSPRHAGILKMHAP